jgi:uncharacterized protein
VFKNLRTQDRRLFAQLDHVAAQLARSAAILARLLAGPRAAEAGLAAEVREMGEQTGPSREQVDVRALTGFASRLDRLEYRELATALDAAAAAVREATAHAESLHASGAPEGVREMAATLAAAAAAVAAAVPHVGSAPDEVVSRSAEVRRLATRGDALYYEGVGALFAGAPDAVEVLRWKEIYEKLGPALASCERAAAVFEQLAKQNA